MIPTCDQFAAAAEALAGARFHHHGRTDRWLDCAGYLFLSAWKIGLPVPDFTGYEPTPDEGVLLSIVADRCEPRPWHEWAARGRIVVLRLTETGPARHFAITLGGGWATHQQARTVRENLEHQRAMICSTWIFRGLQP